MIPLLPIRNKEGRLVFDLESPKIGSWTTVDLYYAMQHGYQVTRVFEVHHFPPTEMMTGLFEGYVDYFLRIKMECDGWPREDMSLEEKQAYIDQVYQENGFLAKMRLNQVEKNPGLRFDAKLKLNSLWGKFIQQPVLEGFQFVTNLRQFREMMLNPTIKEGSLQFMFTSEETLLASYLHAEDFVEHARRFNPYLGAFVTAHGRRRLHEAMFQIGTQRILYCDADSLIYVEGQDSVAMVTKPGLGNWSNVLDTGKWRVEFMAAAPKSYCLVYHHPDTQGNGFWMKSKGLTLNYANQNILTVDTMRDMMMA